MIERTVLETICECELSVDVRDVTEEQVEGWLSRFLIDDKSQDPFFENKMKKLKMDLRIESPGLRFTDLYIQSNKVVKDNG